MGNPEFARFHLQRLLEEGFNVVAVVSAPDRPAGRGMKMNSTPVTEYARDKGIPVLQPTNLKSDQFLEELKSFEADIQVVIAFRMLPVSVWEMPEQGTVNIHASLLPKYRGAAPINWAIINGETETGVTSFKLKHVIDTGDILLQRACSIDQRDNAGTLHDKLMHLGADVIVETLDGLIMGDIVETPQAEMTELPVAPKIFSETCVIDWTKETKEIYDFIRGLSPYPVAHTILDDKRFKIYSAEMVNTAHDFEPGRIILAKNSIQVACGGGFIDLKEVQLEGKRRMDIGEFLRGYMPQTRQL